MSMESDLKDFFDAEDRAAKAGKEQRIRELEEKIFIQKSSHSSNADIDYCFDAARRFIEYDPNQ